MNVLEQEAIVAAPNRRKLWLRYVDDVLEVISKNAVPRLTERINQVDKSASIKFTYEQEKEDNIPFLDTLGKHH